MSVNRGWKTARLMATAGVVGVLAASATAQVSKARPVPATQVSPADAMGPEASKEMFLLKEALAARDNVPTGLRGPGPANDLCSGAIDLATLGFAAGASITVNADNTGATADAEPACGFSNTSQSSGSLGLWYRFAGTGNYVEIATCAQSTDMTLRAFCGPDCSNRTCIGADDDGCVTNSLGSRLGICTSVGQTYWVLVARYGTVTAGAAFSFSVVDNNTACGTPVCGVPANDDCANAVAVSIGSSARGNTSNATSDTAVQTGCGASATAQQGVWYSVVGDGSILRAATCGAVTGSNTIVSVFSGTCGGLTCVANNATLACGTSPRDDTATVDWTSANGSTYFILVSNDTNGAGEFRLAVSSIGQPATNDLCTTATPVALPSSTPGNNFGSTNETGLPTCGGVSSVWNNGVWYRFTGNGNRVSASTCDPATSLNTRVFVFTSPDCVNFTCVGANATASPACPAPATAATVAFCSVQGQDYYVLVTNDTTGTGTFQLVISDLGPAGCVPTGGCCVAGSCSVTTQAACTGTYLGNGTTCNTASAAPNLAIPDNTPAGVDSTILIPAGAGTITDLDVALIIQHTWQGDLRVTLTHVDTATTVTLIDRPGNPASTFGFSTDNYGDPTGGIPFVLDDEAAQVYDAPVVAINNPTGTWKPDLGPLSAFDGQSLSGTWTLNVSDNAGGDTGPLLFWSLLPTPPAPSPCPTGPDCFTRGAVSGAADCSPTYTASAHNRPVNAGHFTVGGANGATDTGECLVDWDGNGCILPSDVASFVTSAFYDFQNGTSDAQITCGGGPTVPATVASFVTRWFNALSNPAGEGCTP